MQKRVIISVLVCLLLLVSLTPFVLADTTQEIQQSLTFTSTKGAYAGMQFSFSITPGLEFVEYRPPSGMRLSDFYTAQKDGKTSYGFISGSNSIQPGTVNSVDLGTLVFRYTEGTTATLTISDIMLVRINSGDSEAVDEETFFIAPQVFIPSTDDDDTPPTDDGSPPPTGGGNGIPPIIVPPDGGSSTSPPLVDIDEDETPLAAGKYPSFINGFDDGTIRPNSHLTRAQLAQIIYNLYGAGRTDFTASYKDVASTHWAYTAIAFCQESSYMIGDNGNFRPADTLTRAELCTAFARIKDLTLNGTHPFTDVGDHWAKEFIGAMYAAGFVNGDPGGTFRPKDNITRAEAVAVICRAEGRDQTSFLENKTFSDLDPGIWYYEYLMHAANGDE